MDILENVRKLIESEDVVAIQGFLQDGKGMLKEEACTQLDSRQIKKLKRDGLAESFVPSLPRLTLAENETVFAAQASADGNCLYNSCSLALVGEERLAQLLRALVSAELYLYSDYYASHPHLLKNLAKGKISLFKTMFEHSLSFAASDHLEKSSCPNKCVKVEALLNCENRRWSPFICLMALSNVLDLPVHSFYPETNNVGASKYYFHLKNAVLDPRKNSDIGKSVNLLWCVANDLEVSMVFKPNHIVPLLFFEEDQPIVIAQKSSDNKSSQPGSAFHTKELMLNSKEISTSKPSSKLTASSKCVIQSTISFPVRENSKIKGNSSSTPKSSKDPKESLAKAVADDPKSSSPLTLQRPKETQGDQFLLRRKTTQYQVSVDASANNVPESSCSKNPYDIGEISKLVDKLSDEEKYHHLISVWKPDENFIYKTRVIFGKCRKFNKDWLHLYNWLAYSKELDGAFCIPCVFFGRRIGINASKMEKLMKCPVTDWSSAKNKLNLHSLKSDVHKTALLTMQSFMDVMEQKKKSIIRVQSSAIDQKIITNRRKLASFIKSVLFLAQHNIPFRGHRDDSKYHGSVECGNFQALLDFRVDSGDATLKEHFESAPRNATYRSKTTQNEMITCCADLVNDDMIKEIKECGIYSILVDEVTDCANKEQMPLVLRYIDQHCEIQERFIKFIHCNTGISGQALKEKVLHCLTQELNLDIQDCRGQCYDGAGNMAGKCSGLAARIRQINKLALYTHCTSHRLNLCVAASCRIQSVKNMMDNIQVISKFFNNSPKRQMLLEKMVSDHLPNYKHDKLIDVCRTRWVLRLDGLDRFYDMYVAIAESLFAIRDNVDGTWSGSAADAFGLASICTNFDFIMNLVTVRNCLGYTRSATVQLQGAKIDITKGLEEVETMIKSVQTARNNVDGYHDIWFQDACKIADQVDAVVKAPRICRKQINRPNNPADTPKGYYKVNVSVPLLDHLLQECSSRFTDQNRIAFKGISLLPSVFKAQYDPVVQTGSKRSHPQAFEDLNDSDAKKPNKEESWIPDLLETSKSDDGIQIQRLDKPWKRDFLEFCKQYKEDLPSPSTISHEVDNWESFWIDQPKEAIPTTISDTMKRVSKLSFPNIFQALKILAILPVTSCTCERSASSIRLLKTYLRSTMTQERLNGLATLYIHKDRDINIERVLDIYSRRHRRRMMVTNIFNSDQEIPMDDSIFTSEIF